MAKVNHAVLDEVVTAHVKKREREAELEQVEALLGMRAEFDDADVAEMVVSYAAKTHPLDELLNAPACRVPPSKVRGRPATAPVLPPTPRNGKSRKDKVQVRRLQPVATPVDPFPPLTPVLRTYEEREATPVSGEPTAIVPVASATDGGAEELPLSVLPRARSRSTSSAEAGKF